MAKFLHETYLRGRYRAAMPAAPVKVSCGTGIMPVGEGVLDGKDEALLAALERNARASVVDLARRIGLSRSATQDRLARLERSGAIAGYTVRRGHAAGTERLRAWLVVHYTAGTKCADVLPNLTRQEGVVAVFTLSGQSDALVEVAVENAAGLERLADAMRAIEGIARVSSHIVLSAHR